MSDVQQTTNQPSATQPKLTKKERHSAILRYMAMGVNNFNYETQQGAIRCLGIFKGSAENLSR